MYCVGGFAFVFVAQDLKDSKEYALKVCNQFIHIIGCRGSLVAKKRRSILVAIFTICLVRSHDIKPILSLHNDLCCRRWQTTQYVHFSLHLWLPCTPPLVAIQPYGIINTTYFDPCRPFVLWWIIRWTHEAIVSTIVIVAPTIASCIHPKHPLCDMLGGDTLVTAAVLTKRSSSCTALCCGVM